MTEKNKEQQTTDAEAKASSAKPSTAKEKPAPKKKVKKSPAEKPGASVSVAAMLIAILASGAAAYNYWQGQNLRQSTIDAMNEQQELREQLDSLRNQLQSTRQVLTEEMQAREQAVAEHQAINANMQAINALLGRTSETWRVAEIEYLLSVANERLNLAQDLHTSIAVFKTADERIKKLSDPGLLPIRKIISDELAALRSVAEPDIEGIALQIGSLAESVENLPLIDKQRIATAIQQREEEKAPMGWQDIPKAVWDDVKSMVQVRRHQQPVEPLLPPAESWFLYQNLRLKLEQARLAVLRRESALFKQYLLDAQSWLKMFFDEEATSVKAALETVNSLQGQELKPVYPDVSNSLRQLRAYVRQQDSAHMNAPVDAQKKAG